MAVTNSLVSQVDLPVWEWTRFSPIATSALSSICSVRDSTKSRYIYHLGATFYRYDTKLDSWQQLQTPAIIPVTTSTLKYMNNHGYAGTVLSAPTSSSIEIPSLQGQVFNGYKLRIVSGAGAGYEGIITGSTENTVWDHGITQTAAGANSIGDANKRWDINQWIGYSVRLVYGTGGSQIRKVLYNDTNTLYFSDTNYQQMAPWNNTGFNAQAPYAVSVTTAGSQASFYIESTVVSLNTPFTTTPNQTSSFIIESGGIMCFSSVAAVPFSSIQFYDVLSDTWSTRTPTAGLTTATFGTDFTIERTSETGGFTYSAVTVTSASTRGIYYSGLTGGAAYTTNDLTNKIVKITSGTGAGQRARIVGNTTNNIEVAKPFAIQPNSTSRFEIWPNLAEFYLAGNGAAAMYKYNVDYDYWTQGPDIDYGQVSNISISVNGQETLTVNSGTRNTGGITTLASAPTAGGTGWFVGDTFTIAAGGGKGRVTAISAGGIVTAVTLYGAGSGYSVASGIATTAIAPAVGVSLTVNITAVGVVGRIVTIQNHNLISGDTVTFSGCTEALWNASYQVLATDAITGFDVATTATATMVASNTSSTILITDSSKNWVASEHIGKIVTLNTAGTANPVTQIRRITANTNNTLSVAALGIAPNNGTSRYVISQPEGFGAAQQYLVSTRSANSYATSGSNTTLIDTKENWLTNQWAGYRFRINSGTGVGSEVPIISNTSNTLTYGSQSFIPDTTTQYKIMDTYGLLTSATNSVNAVLGDTTKAWATNQWAGRRVRIISGTGAGQEASITSNTANALTITGVFTTAPDTTSNYVIYEVPAKGAATELMWAYNNTDTTNKGRFIYAARGGGSNLFDRYNITTNIWDLAINTSPHTEIFTTGTMYTYDGSNGIIIHRGDAIATMRNFRMDLTTMQVETLGMPPYGHGTPTIGNRMDVVTTVDGLNYLYIMRHTGQEMWRTLLF